MLLARGGPDRRKHSRTHEVSLGREPEQATGALLRGLDARLAQSFGSPGVGRDRQQAHGLDRELPLGSAVSPPCQVARVLARHVRGQPLHGPASPASRMFRDFAQDLGGAEVKAIQKLLGHADIRTTDVYTHLFGGEKEAAIASLPAALEKSGHPVGNATSPAGDGLAGQTPNLRLTKPNYGVTTAAA